jgi:hypothetical protein
MPPERLSFFFYQEMGGLRATDENDAASEIVYYIGIIGRFFASSYGTLYSVKK